MVAGLYEFSLLKVTFWGEMSLLKGKNVAKMSLFRVTSWNYPNNLWEL